MIIQLGIRPEVTATPTLRHRTLIVPSKPLPRVVQVQNMFAPETKGWEPHRGPFASVVAVGRRGGGGRRQLGELGGRGRSHGAGAGDAHDFEADDAAGQVALTIRARDARGGGGGVVRGGGRRRVCVFEGLVGYCGRRGWGWLGWSAAAAGVVGGGGGWWEGWRGGRVVEGSVCNGGGMMTPADADTAKGTWDPAHAHAHARNVGRGGRSQEGSLGIAVDAAQGDLSRRRLDLGPPVAVVLALAALGRLHLELGPLVESFVALQVRPVRVPPGGAAVVVYVPRRRKRHDQRGGLHVVEFGDIRG